MPIDISIDFYIFLDIFLVITYGYRSLPSLFSDQLSDQAFVCYMLLISFALAMLKVLIAYFVVNRKKHPLPIACLGILGASWGFCRYVLFGGFGLFFPVGVMYENIRESVDHFESALERNSPYLHPWSSWLVPLRYYLLLALAALAAAALIMGIYNLKKRRQFSQRQVLSVAIPMVCIVAISVFPDTAYTILDWQDFILPLLLLLTLWKKKSVSASDSDTAPLPEPTQDATKIRSE